MPQSKPQQNGDTPSKDDSATEAAASETLPTNAEDRAAAVALSSLNAPAAGADTDNESSGVGAASQPSAADQEALGKAMNRLEMIAGGGGKKAAPSALVDNKTKTDGEDAKAAKKKALKVSPEHVNFLVDQLDLTRIKATELLKDHEGDPVQAVRAYITQPAI
ncbi:hypothetical protein FQN57_003470 [Myotisia sp. PD_48]|nr:hypothetical protein FQN57_003470 [Myotisia sp. PD_48]